MFTAIVAGHTHSCALDRTGHAYCWGANEVRELGVASTETCANDPCSTQPLLVADIMRFTALSSRWSHTCGLSLAGDIYCWGWNFFGQLGTGQSNRQFFAGEAPQRVTGGLKFSQVTTGYSHTCGLTTTGVAFCWGGPTSGQNFGQLGDGTTEQRLSPTPVAGNLRFRMLSAGWFDTCGVTTTDQAFCWGQGFGLVPTELPASTKFTAVSVGAYDTCWLTSGGDAYCASTLFRTLPRAFATALAFAHVDLGDEHACGVSTQGTAVCWGWNRFGVLGIGDDSGPDRCDDGGTPVPCSLTPLPVIGGTGFEKVSVGSAWPYSGHTCGVTIAHALLCWGANEHGQLGDGTTMTRFTPGAVKPP
jgi:alpha-tubulin suppressor-like RCC1 family protein